MASRIQGITVEIGGDTTKLSTALSKVNKEIRDTQAQLKDVNKLLKLDPGNAELMAQKQRLLSQAVSETKEKLDALKLAGQQANEALAKGEISRSQYDALQREIAETEQALRETYLKPFQALVENYDANGLMSSYNRIGAVWAGGSKVLLTDVLRGEWGFHGAVITDYCDHHAFMNGDQALRAGTSLWMSGVTGGQFAQETASDSYLNALRRAAKKTLYMTLHVRVVNRDYSAASGDAGILRPAYKESGLGIVQPLIYVVIVLGIALIALCIRFLVIDHKLRKELKAQK